MKLELLIIGTSHRYQLGAFSEQETPRADLDKFHNYLTEICKSRSVDTIAEEANEECTRRPGQSLLKEFSTIQHLDHVYCEPNSAEKKQLRIVDQSTLLGSEYDANLSEEEIVLMCERSLRQRELFWLGKLEQEVKGKRVLFVCGANHVASFASLLLFSRLRVQILNFDWSPANQRS